MIERMPTYSQAPIKNYLETGKFKDQTPEPLSADEAAEMKDMITLMTAEVVSQDNGPHDSNPAPGVIDSKDDFFGDFHIEFEQNQEGGQGFGMIGDDQSGAVLYARNGAESMDVVVVSNQEGAEDGVIHISLTDPNGSFMTFSDPMAARF